ncbi:hypothetical protein MMC06_006641 [Schaereria dolodes]|nr:hypothetical protein [Schaereria dolodes]
MKTVYATQAEHSERLSRLERRQDDDSRMRSVWGNSSPFPSILSGTPQQGSYSLFGMLSYPDQKLNLDLGYNPAAEAFKNFDQDQHNNMLGSLHLDTDGEPRRGASRANSVRFDESALQGHFGHVSRSSSEFFPLRTGSGIGSHPMAERTLSHKSDGRQSSAGQSVQSVRTNSLGFETRHPSLAVGLPMIPLGPPPGLSILGPMPSIIRCWLDTRFTNESLLYAVVCTGSSSSLLDLRLASRLGLDEHFRHLRGEKKVRAQVYLPEATVQQSSSRSSSPAPQLPTLTVDFVVREMDVKGDSMQVFLGSDVLRARNADILFSQDRVTLFDDDRNKLAVPLVRPENPNMYRRLVTTNGFNLSSTRIEDVHSIEQGSISQLTRIEDTTQPNLDTNSHELLSNDDGDQTFSTSNSLRGLSLAKQAAIGDERKSSLSRAHDPDEVSILREPITRDADLSTHGNLPDASTRADPGSIWGSWRRDSTPLNARPDTSFSNIASNASHHRPGRGRGMKVLKPARSGTTPRSFSTTQTPADSDTALTKSMEFGQRRGSQVNLDSNQSAQRPHVPRRSLSGELKTPLQPLTNKPRSANPIGGASAFGWLNSSPEKRPSATAE